MDINWGGYNSFFERNNAGDSIQRGFEAGQAERKQRMQENALAQYATNPNDPGAVNALAQVDPRLAIQAREKMAIADERQRKTQTELTEASRANVLRGAQIIRQVQPKDQASWDQVLATAQAAGIDTSTVPRQFDPNFATNMVNLADTFEPVKAEASPFSFIAGQPGAGVYVGDRRTGTLTEKVRANDGTVAAGTPVAAPNAAGGPKPGTVEGGYRFKGGDPSRQENWEPVAGGPTPQASGNFRPEGN